MAKVSDDKMDDVEGIRKFMVSFNGILEWDLADRIKLHKEGLTNWMMKKSELNAQDLEAP